MKELSCWGGEKIRAWHSVDKHLESPARWTLDECLCLLSVFQCLQQLNAPKNSRYLCQGPLLPASWKFCWQSSLQEFCGVLGSFHLSIQSLHIVLSSSGCWMRKRLDCFAITPVFAQVSVWNVCCSLIFFILGGSSQEWVRIDVVIGFIRVIRVKRWEQFSYISVSRLIENHKPLCLITQCTDKGVLSLGPLHMCSQFSWGQNSISAFFSRSSQRKKNNRKDMSEAWTNTQHTQQHNMFAAEH